jgi:hypothetical protein
LNSAHVENKELITQIFILCQDDYEDDDDDDDEKMKEKERKIIDQWLLPDRTFKGKRD